MEAKVREREELQRLSDSEYKDALGERSELRVGIVHGVSLAGLCVGGRSRLLNTSSMRAHGLQMLVEQLVLFADILAASLQVRDLLLERFALLLPAAF